MTETELLLLSFRGRSKEVADPKMKFLFFVFCAFLTPGGCLPPEFSDILDGIATRYRPQTYSLITDIVREVIKGIEGEKDVNVPDFAIDPLNRLENVTLKSRVDDVTFKLGPKDSNRAVDIEDLTIPVALVTATGQYDFEGISVAGLDIYGKGDFRMRAEELRIFGSLLAKFSSARGWKVEKFEAKASMKECRVVIENLMNGEPMGDFINFMVNEIIKIAVDLLEGFVKEFNEDIKEELGRFLNKLTGFEDIEQN